MPLPVHGQNAQNATKTTSELKPNIHYMTERKIFDDRFCFLEGFLLNQLEKQNKMDIKSVKTPLYVVDNFFRITFIWIINNDFTFNVKFLLQDLLDRFLGKNVKIPVHAKCLCGNLVHAYFHIQPGFIMNFSDQHVASKVGGSAAGINNPKVHVNYWYFQMLRRKGLGWVA